MTQSLTEFLLARIAEDEASVDTVPDWRCTDSARGEGWGTRGDCLLCDAYMFDGTEDATEQAHWDHLEGTHRRTRVLAECEAKRRILDGFTEAGKFFNYLQATDAERDADRERFRVAKLLALPYSDHPDYRAEWKP